MKRSRLLLITLFTLLLTGMILARAGWLGVRANLSPHRGAHSSAQHLKSLSSEAVWRWRNAEPQHWRACLLQR